MTSRLPAEELLQVIRISQAERRAPSGRRSDIPDRHETTLVRVPDAGRRTAIPEVRRPVREIGPTWAGVPQG